MAQTARYSKHYDEDENDDGTRDRDDGLDQKGLK